MYTDVDCPYCGTGQEINHDDGYGYEEDRTHEQTCGTCEHIFTYTTSISFHYNAKQADCLNGQDHKYKQSSTFPKWRTRMRCCDCDNERPLTEREWLAFLKPMEVITN